MYHYPLLSNLDVGFIREQGPSFGSLLFLIVRALQEAKMKKNFDRLTMSNLKIGQFLIKEKDKKL